MKARLIWNGILSIVTTVATISFFVGLIGYFKQVPWFFYVVILVLICSSVAEFVMGIVTLSMEKDQRVRGLTIASGVLGIIGIPLFVNAIVSFIAVGKINNNSKTLVENKEV